MTLKDRVVGKSVLIITARNDAVKVPSKYNATIGRISADVFIY